MGCDGGTIPTRDELVRTKKKPEQKDKKSELAFKWKHCAISQEPLRKPVVACELGCLYNKESILELLLDRSKFESARFEHIKGLRSVKELNLTENPAYKAATEKDVLHDTITAEYICPVSGLEMNGVYKFSYLLSCGCVFAERALSEVKAETCSKCGKEYRKDDVITLNGSDEEQEQLYIRMEQRRQQAKLNKKKKKAAATSQDTEAGEPESKKPAEEPVAGTSGTATLTNGTTSQSEKSKLTQIGSGLKGKLVAKAASGKLVDTKKPASIQKDPSASAAFKSLFTSSDKCKNQQKAHWVTYNPCHY